MVRGYLAGYAVEVIAHTSAPLAGVLSQALHTHQPVHPDAVLAAAATETGARA
jgi:hypothetical protein